MMRRSTESSPTLSPDPSPSSNPSRSPSPKKISGPIPAKEFHYLVVTLPDNNVKCLVCQNSMLNKTFNIKRHYNVKHADKYDGIVGDARKELIEKLKAELPSSQQVNIGLFSSL